MHIKQVAAIAILALASSSAMAQSPECTLCISTKIHSFSECRDVPFEGVPNPLQLSDKQKSCFCKVSDSLSSLDTCSQECPVEDMASMKAAFLGFKITCASIFRSSSSTLSIPKAGAALVAAAAALQAVL
ncbi:hypothetical protein BGZ73_003810 [Actinomortierella ambigua]|nr:hypothetical protein BGZ73_003810 [Actinomortierella ambigua]